MHRSISRWHTKLKSLKIQVKSRNSGQISFVSLNKARTDAITVSNIKPHNNTTNSSLAIFSSCALYQMLVGVASFSP